MRTHAGPTDGRHQRLAWQRIRSTSRLIDTSIPTAEVGLVGASPQGEAGEENNGRKRRLPGRVHRRRSRYMRVAAASMIQNLPPLLQTRLGEPKDATRTRPLWVRHGTPVCGARVVAKCGPTKIGPEIDSKAHTQRGGCSASSATFAVRRLHCSLAWPRPAAAAVRRRPSC